MSSASPLQTSTVSPYSASARRPLFDGVMSVRQTLDNEVRTEGRGSFWKRATRRMWEQEGHSFWSGGGVYMSWRDARSSK